jgi:hypothetical protein
VNFSPDWAPLKNVNPIHHAGGFFAFVTPRMDWSMGTAEYAQRGRTNSFTQREAEMILCENPARLVRL